MGYRLVTRPDAYGRSDMATVWTYRTGSIWATDEAEARSLLLAEAHRILPADRAEARILSIRRSPSGRYSAMIRRERVEDGAR